MDGQEESLLLPRGWGGVVPFEEVVLPIRQRGKPLKGRRGGLWKTRERRP